MTYTIYSQDTAIGEQEASTPAEALEQFCKRMGWDNDTGLYAEVTNADDAIKAADR